MEERASDMHFTGAALLVHSSLRRSPRLSSTPESSIRKCSSRKRPSKLEPFDAMALSLHVVVSDKKTGCDSDAEPVPLKIYNPEHFRNTASRRSSRFTSNIYRSALHESSEPNDLNALPALSLIGHAAPRRSPRAEPNCLNALPALSPPGHAAPRRSPCISQLNDENALLALPDAAPGKRVRSSPRVSESNDLNALPLLSPHPRRSPRFISSSVVMEPLVKRRRMEKKSESASDVCLRRSPRYSAALSEFENGDARCELLALPEPEKVEAQLSEKMMVNIGRSDGNIVQKSLRSRTIPFRVVPNDDDVEETNSGLVCLPKKKDTSAVPFCVDGDVHVEIKTPNKAVVKNEADLRKSLSEKCLRSRKIAFHVVGAEKSVEAKADLIEWPASEASVKKAKKQKKTAFFLGEPVPEDEARARWNWRYELKSQRRKGQSWILNADEEDEIVLNVECHYTKAKVDGCTYNLGDCAHIKGNGRQKHVGKILEFFKTMEGDDYFRVQWFYRAEDTVMKNVAAFHDKKRLFFSTLMNDNSLDCIVSKVNVVEIAPALGLLSNTIQPSDFYYDTEYCVEYSTFRSLLTDIQTTDSRAFWAFVDANTTVKASNGDPLAVDGTHRNLNVVIHFVTKAKLDSFVSFNRNFCIASDNPMRILGSPALSCIDSFPTAIAMAPSKDLSSYESYRSELALLDLYSGCGGMSTGLCLGAKLSGVKLVRNTSVEDFLELLKRWEKLCKSHALDDYERTLQSRPEDIGESKSSANSSFDAKLPAGEYEVSCLVDICYGDPSDSGKHGLKFKVRWKGYDPTDDTWEPIENLSNCQEHIRNFVRDGLKSKILPVPGDVDVICGGPPCQGISGYNRFRNVDSPLTDERNRQIIVFMDVVKFLKPKYVLMENVTDILRFDKASLGRYALSRLVHMKYQARLGTMAAGCYGLPQFRLRVFLWGALPTEKLPQFPLPTHDVVVRYWPPSEFEQNTVAYNEGEPRELEDAIVLRDAISDLPAVTSQEIREEMTYERPPETEFQKYIRLTKNEMMGVTSNGLIKTKNAVLYDHRPYQLSEDDCIRVCLVPRRKGANFRDFPGVVVTDDNVAHRDPKQEPAMLPSGKPLVPDYVFTFEKGKSKRPFARLWWDETVATVVTFPCLHNQAAIHPEQDRVLTLRECARLQGFPDFYRFCGTIKERYCQVGNAVSVPVARALGYALGMAFRKLSTDGPLMTLPPKFSSQQSPIEEIVELNSE
ncbi:hypothetical protein RJ639_008664 [Escallonia herrerae]|uniref:Cytosine-specific methyltransferase n=1 Tax=Escallonia herrerae TaxID=1293975 RepID=A0AA88VRJ4_9ASTE|nr:hypothetical protein RJ639_008664 [Escallonia herrerae]